MVQLFFALCVPVPVRDTRNCEYCLIQVLRGVGFVDRKRYAGVEYRFGIRTTFLTILSNAEWMIPPLERRALHKERGFVHALPDIMRPNRETLSLQGPGKRGGVRTEFWKYPHHIKPPGRVTSFGG